MEGNPTLCHRLLGSPFYFRPTRPCRRNVSKAPAVLVLVINHIAFALVWVDGLVSVGSLLGNGILNYWNYVICSIRPVNAPVQFFFLSLSSGEGIVEYSPWVVIQSPYSVGFFLGVPDPFLASTTPRDGVYFPMRTLGNQISQTLRSPENHCASKKCVQGKYVGEALSQIWMAGLRPKPIFSRMLA